MRIRREVVGALCALLVTACAAAAAGPDGAASTATMSPTVDGVGVLPVPLPTLAPASTQRATSTSTTQPDTSTSAFVAEGNRVLLIGDSILASTSRRYSNDTCKALVPLGWRVEVEAEVSRPIQFANEVLARRMSAGWDVGVVFLGTNYGGDGNEYLKQLNKVITAFAPRPVVLITVSEFRDDRREVNNTIRALVEVYPEQVSVIDWSSITEADPSVLNIDGIHPTPEGRQVLAQAIADHLGQAPATPGACLDSVFTDDSAGSIDGGSTTATTVKPRNTGTTVKPVTSTTVRPGTSTTVRPGTSTTVRPGGPTTSVAGGSTTVPGTTGTTVVSTTGAPTTTVGLTVAPTVPPTAPPTVPPTTGP